MNIGNLRHKIKVQRNNGVDDGGGGTTDNWVDLKYVWADVRPIDASEWSSASTRQMNTSHIVVIRYQKDLLVFGKTRFIFEGRVLSIDNFVNKGNRNIQFNVMCSEVN